jgi:hypothetical protein
VDKEEKEFEVIKQKLAFFRLFISLFFSGGLVGLYGFYRTFDSPSRLVPIALAIIGFVLMTSAVKLAKMYIDALNNIEERYNIKVENPKEPEEKEK